MVSPLNTDGKSHAENGAAPPPDPWRVKLVSELEPRSNPTLLAATLYLQSGLSMLPVKRDGSKAPSGIDLPVKQDERGEVALDDEVGPVRTWDPYKQRVPTDQEVRSWFGREAPPGIGVINGKVSGNKELIDFDKDADVIYPQWCELVEAECPGLLARLTVVRTPRQPAGYHVHYRCPEVVIPGNTKLAEEPGVDAKSGKPTKLVLVETRGEGGYGLAPGSPAACHETGGTYEHFSGPKLSQIEFITAGEREVLWRCARSFNRVPPEEPSGGQKPREGNGRLLPGEDYDLRGPDWLEILDGWEVARQSGEVRYLRRPGKAGPGWSATVGRCKGKKGEDLLYVFTSNAHPFEANKAYGKFRAFTLLRHNGDFSAAARDLGRQGYGDQEQQTTASAGASLPEGPPWPDDLHADAHHGLAGDVLRLVEPTTEADPAAVLVQLLVAFGNLVGRSAYCAVEADRHFTNEYVVLVGRTSKARKGTSWGRVRRLLRCAEEEIHRHAAPRVLVPLWADHRVQSGLSSGEGLVYHVRDKVVRREKVREKDNPPRYEEVETDSGVEDKRLLAVESEFANVLKQTERQGNTLSIALRQGWDCGDLGSLTKNDPTRATGAHVSMVGHITAEELKRYLTSTECANGFGNRFLWLCVKRSKELPESVDIDPAQADRVVKALACAVNTARRIEAVSRDGGARELWRQEYSRLSADRPGLAGALLCRAEAHVLRLSLLYALLDGCNKVKAEHLRAALAVWRYCEQSVLHMFGDSLGDPVADDLLRMLRAAPDGMSRTDISRAFGNNRRSEDIGRALALLASCRLAWFEKRPTGGGPQERWYAVTG
jgi:hypothetical protein